MEPLPARDNRYPFCPGPPPDETICLRDANSPKRRPIAFQVHLTPNAASSSPQLVGGRPIDSGPTEAELTDWLARVSATHGRHQVNA